MKDHKSNPATVIVYSIPQVDYMGETVSQNWYVGYIGAVAVGNGQYSTGYLRSVQCANEEAARNLATNSNHPSITNA
jgi:hypothetical protein